MSGRACLGRGGVRTSMMAAVAVLMVGAGISNGTNATGGSAGGISGKVVDARGQPVAGAVVIVCEQASGIPLARGTLQPFINDRAQALGGDILSSVTDAHGHFTFEKIPVGSYRLIAQSWRNKTSIRAVLEVNGEEIELHGVANEVRVFPNAGSCSPPQCAT